MTKQGWTTLIGFILLMLTIFFGGPYLSSVLDKNYRKGVDKNASIVNAVIYQKKTHKGNTVHFKYSFQNKTYKNSEQSDSFYEALNIGDTVQIKIDTLHPSKSYIVSY